ncbi:MAG: hypothetical protein M3R55_04760 [Acidobacteriota bacterium]|nr:hypothetical protein [Acidobacteriota bacterium]
MSAVAHIAVVGSLAYRERMASLPESFQATLVPEPGNRYFLHAIAVHAPSGKIGYVAPEASRSRYERVAMAVAAGPVTCPARRAGTDRTAQGAIEVFVDLTAFPPAE